MDFNVANDKAHWGSGAQRNCHPVQGLFGLISVSS